MKPIIIEISNQRDQQREDLFLLTVIERVLAGYVDTVSYVDMAKFIEVMERKRKALKIAPLQEEILGLIKKRLSKPPSKSPEFQHVIKTIPTSQKATVRNQIPQHHHQGSKNQEQQTHQVSDEEIVHQLQDLATQSNEKKSDPRAREQKSSKAYEVQSHYQPSNSRKRKPQLNKQKYLIGGSEISNLKNETSELQQSDDQKNLLSFKDSNKNSKLTTQQHTEPQQKLPSTAQSRLQSRLQQNQALSRKSTDERKQELKQQLQRLDDEEAAENNKLNIINASTKVYTNSQHIQDTGEIHNNAQSGAPNGTTIMQPLQHYPEAHAVQSSINGPANQQQDLIKTIAKNPQPAVSYMMMENNNCDASIEHNLLGLQSDGSNADIMKPYKSDAELQKPSIHFYASSHNLRQPSMDHKDNSGTSILEEPKLAYQIQIQEVMDTNPVPTIAEESQEGSPNQRTRTNIVLEKKTTLGVPGLQGTFPSQPNISRQGSNPSNAASASYIPSPSNMFATTGQSGFFAAASTQFGSTGQSNGAFTQHSNQMPLQLQSQGRIEEQVTPSSRAGRGAKPKATHKTKSSFKNQQQQQMQMQSQQVIQHTELPIATVNQMRSEDSAPESKMTIESSQGERSQRSRKGPKNQLRLPAAAAAAVQFARRKSSNQQQTPIDPKKVEQQEKDRLRQLEYQKQIERMRMERELMQHYSIPENMPLAQKKQMIDIFIKEIALQNDQEVKYQVMLYNQRQEQIANARQANYNEFTTDIMANCYGDMENLLENRFKLKKDETSKIVLLKFENQIHTHFPGRSKEFIKDENSPTKRTMTRQSQLDPIQIQASMNRKEQFFKEGELLQLFKSFEAEYGKRVVQCELDYPVPGDLACMEFATESGYMPRVKKRKHTKRKTQRIAMIDEPLKVASTKWDSLRQRVQRISQMGRYLIQSQ